MNNEERDQWTAHIELCTSVFELSRMIDKLQELAHDAKRDAARSGYVDIRPVQLLSYAERRKERLLVEAIGGTRVKGRKI